MKGVEIILDHWYDMVIVGIVVIAAILAIGHSLGQLTMMVIGFARKGGTLKAGPIEVSEGSVGPVCTPYVAEHTSILNELRADQALAFGLHMESLKGLRALLEAAKGDCNGNVDEALASIKRKQKQLEESLIKKMAP